MSFSVMSSSTVSCVSSLSVGVDGTGEGVFHPDDELLLELDELLEFEVVPPPA